MNVFSTQTMRDVMKGEAALLDAIEQDFQERQLTRPTATQALDWALTELAEAKELLLNREAQWVRNHPERAERYTPKRFEEELGDIIRMCLLSAWAERNEVDPVEIRPLQSILEKAQRKIADHHAVQALAESNPNETQLRFPGEEWR